MDPEPEEEDQTDRRQWQPKEEVEPSEEDRVVSPGAVPQSQGEQRRM